MNVILKRTLVVVMLIHSLPLLAQNAVTAEPPPSPLKIITEQSDPSKEESKPNLVDEKKQRLKKIQQQMQQLTLLWEEMQQRKQQESLPQPAILKPTVQQPTVLQPAIPQSTVPPPMPDLVQQPTRVPEPPNPNPPPTKVVPDKVQDEGTKASPINSLNPPEITPNVPAIPPAQTEPEQQDKETGPIDRFALSSSLFATGHYKECLHVLASLDKSQWTPHESHWAQFLEASCYRKLDQPEEAQRRYRRLVAENDSEWIGTLSRWWLDEIQDRKKIQQEIGALSTALTQWETEVDELVKQND